MLKKFILKLKDCLHMLKIIWRQNDEERNSLIKLYNKIESSPNKKFVLECVDFVREADKTVIITKNRDELSYNTDDEEYDVDFRNSCKEIIREDLFNTIGQEEYQNNLAKFEPDLNVAFTELDYHQSRADYNERMVDYLKAVNDPTGMKSPQLSHLWNDIQEMEKVMRMAEMRLNNL